MSSVMVFVKRHGLLVACKAFRTQDGCEWFCAHCETLVIRASFGVMNGLIQCPCGAEVEINVDGVPVDVEHLNVLPGRPSLAEVQRDPDEVHIDETYRAVKTRTQPAQYFRIAKHDPLPRGYAEAPEALSPDGRLLPQFWSCARLEPNKRRKKKLTDEEFLRDCGIAIREEKENA